MSEDEYVDALLDQFVSMGLVEIVGIDSVSGEFLYKINPILSGLYPELEKTMQEDFARQVNSLWVKGFVSMDVTAVSPMVSLNESAFDEKKVANLTVEERNALLIIIDKMKSD